MKLYILRHEDRTQDATFFSPLTKVGLENSVKLIEDLKKLDITHIYSSPYIRTLQTCYPYAKDAGIKIKLEYGLCEIQHSDIIPKNSYQVRLPEYIAEGFNYDSEYKEIIAPENLSYPEDDKLVSKRIKEVLKHIFTSRYDSNNNILLVSHQPVCKSILGIVKRRSILKPDESVFNEYPKGALSQVYDNNIWSFKPINWKPK